MNEIRAGLVGLEYYSPDSKKWGQVSRPQNTKFSLQAHSHARYALLRVVLAAGQDFVSITETVGDDGEPDLKFKLDGKKIESVGKPAIGEFLRKLQVCMDDPIN